MAMFEVLVMNDFYYIFLSLRKENLFDLKCYNFELADFCTSSIYENKIKIVQYY